MKKFIKIVVSIVGTAILSVAVGYFLTTLFKRGGVVWDIRLFSEKLFAILSALIFISLSVCWLYVIIKYRFFSSSKLIRKNDRTTSNLYDNQDFMSSATLYQKYGNYDFNTLKDIDNVHGYVLNSHFFKNKLRLSVIPNQHAMLIGTNGTGKSLYVAGMSIQANAVSKSKPSMIINDLAGELYEQHSAQLKENGYNVAVINLREPRNSLIRYNPCSYIWDLFYEYQADKTKTDVLDRVAVNINELALVICPDATYGEKNWSQGARGILIGCLWGMLEDSLVPEFNFTKDMFTLTQVSNIVNRQKDKLMSFLFNRDLQSKVFDSASLIKDNKSEKTVDSYLSHLTTSLTLFLETGMQFITSATDFDIKTITKQPTALFIIVPVEYPTRHVIGCMIYTQIYNHLAYEASLKRDSKLDRTVYFFLDEFGNLPKIPSFTNWITTSRKMQIFFFIMLQSNQQLDTVYGKEQAQIICNNCHVQMFLGASDEQTIDYFKKKFGTYTAIARSQNLDTQNLSITEFKGNTTLVKKDLVTSSELQQIQLGEMYAIIIREKPIHTKLVPIFAPEIQNIIKIKRQDEKIPKYSYENKIYDLYNRAKLLGEEDEQQEGVDTKNENQEQEKTTETNQRSSKKIDRKKFLGL